MDVMIVEDDLSLQVQIARLLMARGMGVICAGGMAMAQSMLRLSPPHALILGERVDGRLSHGLALLAECRNPDIAVVMLTDRTGPDLLELSDLIPALRALLGRRIGPEAVVQVLRSVLDDAGALPLKLVPVAGADLADLADIPAQMMTRAEPSDPSPDGAMPPLPRLQSIRPMPTADHCMPAGDTSENNSESLAENNSESSAENTSENTSESPAESPAVIRAERAATGTDAAAPAEFDSEGGDAGGGDAGQQVSDDTRTRIMALRTLADACDDAAAVVGAGRNAAIAPAIVPAAWAGASGPIAVSPAPAEPAADVPGAPPFAPLVADRQAWAAWRAAAGLLADPPAKVIPRDRSLRRADGQPTAGTDDTLTGTVKAWPKPDAVAMAHDHARLIRAAASAGGARRLNLG